MKVIEIEQFLVEIMGRGAGRGDSRREGGRHGMRETGPPGVAAVCEGWTQLRERD
jgi:hypothetical protein